MMDTADDEAQSINYYAVCGPILSAMADKWFSHHLQDTAQGPSQFLPKAFLASASRPFRFSPEVPRCFATNDQQKKATASITTPFP
jgi:hypothetical protein